MKFFMQNDNSDGPNRRKLNFRLESSTIQLGISVIIVFFAWFYILPTNVCSYAYVLASEHLVSNESFLILSNLAGFLGLIVGGFFAYGFKRTDELLLGASSILLVINILLFILPSQLGLYFLLAQYLLLGFFVSVSTYLFLVNTFNNKRYLYVGSILTTVMFSSAFFKPAAEGITIDSIYMMNFVFSLIVFIFIVLLNVTSSRQYQIIPYQSDNKPINGAFLLLCIYALILSFSLGFLIKSFKLSLFCSETISTTLRTATYVGTMLLVLSLPTRKHHMGVIVYVANALLIMSIAFIDFFNFRSAFAAIVCIMLYFSIAINQLFIFDTTFELATKAKVPSLIVGIGLFAFVFGSAVGDHYSEGIVADNIEMIDRVLISLIAIASSILPWLRISLSNLSNTSIFRINPVVADRLVLGKDLPPDSGASLPNNQESDISLGIANFDTLTNREKEVFDLLVKGYPSELIASTLFISSNTLKRHVQNIYNKLNVHNRAELFKLLHKT